MEILVLGNYCTNCYLVWNDSRECVIIDPGFEPETVLDKCTELGLKVAAILLTHGHFDHVGGVADLAAETGCRVYLCTGDCAMPAMLTAGKLYYTNAIMDGDEICEAGLTFRVIHTPGHTPGSVCFVCGDTMFSGDTLFAGSCGRTDLPGGSTQKIRTSLARLAALEGDYRVFPGHGSDTTLNTERATNPYM